MSGGQTGRWAGRNATKDEVRSDIWRSLEQTGVGIGPVWSVIPNFVGADTAAWRLAQTSAGKARAHGQVQSDPPQIR